MERLLKGRREFVSAEEYYSNLIEFIAFNCLAEHPTITDKMRICEVFLGEELGIAMGTVEAVHKAIAHLITLSLVPPFTLFRHYIFSMAFEQSCILNLLSTAEIVRIVTQIASSDLSPYNKIILMQEVDRCLLWLKIRHIFHKSVDVLVIKR
jgi:hypothetical protein